MGASPIDEPGADDGDDDVVFECLGEFSRRLDGGEAIEPAAFRERLGDRYERFLELLEMEGALKHAIEPGEPDVHLPRVTPARYSDFRTVGEGGMGLVFKATDNTLNRTVAFKVVRPRMRRPNEALPTGPMEMATPAPDTPSSYAFRSLRKRFLQEAWVTSGLTHPGIIPIYELGETPQGVPYYTMRFVEGERTFAVAIADARERDIEARLALLEPFLKVCDTIRYAHARGVVHRDLKPENVAIGTFGEVIVLDWGLAKLGVLEDPMESDWAERVHEFRNAADLKTMTAALGTPGYMAPEAAEGKVTAVDERSDIYSLGVMLFEILTGQLPYRFESFIDLIRQLRGDDVPRADLIDLQVPTPLADLSHAAMQRDPDARPQTVGELAERIRTWQVHQAAERESERLLEEARTALAAAEDLSGAALLRQLDRATAPVGQVLRKRPAHPDAADMQGRIQVLRERGIRERGARARRRLMAGVGGAALLVIAVLGLVFSELLREERDQATERLWQSYRDQARAGRFSGRAGRRLDSLAALEKAVEIRADDVLRNDVLACIPLADVRLRSTWRHEPKESGAIGVDDAFRTYVRAGHDGALEFRDVTSGRSLGRIPSQGGHVHWTLRFIRDGAQLAVKYRQDGRLVVWDVETKEQVLKSKTTYVRDAFDLDPSGTRMALGKEDGTITIYSYPEEEPLETIKTGVRPYSVRFSPDGKRVAVSSMQNLQVVVAEVTGKIVQRMPHRSAVRRISWSPDGRYIAAACGDKNVYVWRVDGAQPYSPYRVLRGHQAVVTDVVFTRGGELLVSTSWDHSIRIWDHEANALRLSLPVAGGNVHIGPRDRRLILQVHTRVELYDLVLPAAWSRVPMWGEMSTGGVCFSPDGSHLVLTERRDVHFLDLASRRFRGVLRGRRWNSFFVKDRLFVSGDQGVFAHEVQFGDTAVTTRALDWTPPFDFKGQSQKSSASPDGKWLAVCSPNPGHVVIFPFDGSAPPKRLRHRGATRARFNADASLVVTAAWRGSEICVWDTAGGELLHTLPATEFGRALFTHDGRHIIASDAAQLTVIEVGTWKQKARLDAPPTFVEPAMHPSGGLLAIADEGGTVFLMVPETLEVLARLEPQDVGQPRDLAFSPDGSVLAVARLGHLGVELWDLRAIRERLRELDLDWK